MSVNSDEIDKHCLRLSNRMLAPRGWSKDDLLSGYADSLAAFEHGLVGDVVQKLVTGGYDDEAVSTTFAPTPPALAALVRQAQGIRVARRRVSEGDDGPRRFAFKAPGSRRLAMGVHRGQIAALVADGTYPRGSIWFPGDSDGDPAFGDVYAPDPSWALPTLIGRGDADAPGADDLRMTPEERRHCADRLRADFAASPANLRSGFFARDFTARMAGWLHNLRRGFVAVFVPPVAQADAAPTKPEAEPPRFYDRLEWEQRERGKRERIEEARLRAELDEQGSRGA